MYQTLIGKIEDTLETIEQVQAVYPYPATRIEKYPAVIFFPSSLDNAFESTKDNMKVYRFVMYAVVGAVQKTRTDIFNTVLPKTVDAIVAAFDSAWDQGVIDGHRARVLISSGLWGMGEEQRGLEAWAELNVEVRVLTTN